MFFVVGLGLGDAKDITVKGLDVVKKSHRVYLEAYTSILTVGKEVLEKFYGRELLLADRELVESGSHEILHNAASEDVVLLVAGDPFGATTHTDLLLRAQREGIPCRVIHNASILNAAGCCGLQLYNFGETVSIPYWSCDWEPDSFYDKICANHNRGLHTLCLLDIRVKEPTLASLTKKKKEYEPPRFMNVNEAAALILSICKRRRDDGEHVLEIDGESQCVALARVGSAEQKICHCSLKEMVSVELGPPLHSLIVVGQLHPIEEEFLAQFSSHQHCL